MTMSKRKHELVTLATVLDPSAFLNDVQISRPWKNSSDPKALPTELLWGSNDLR